METSQDIIYFSRLHLHNEYKGMHIKSVREFILDRKTLQSIYDEEGFDKPMVFVDLDRDIVLY